MLFSAGGVPLSVSGVSLKMVAIKFARPDSGILATKSRRVILREREGLACCKLLSCICTMLSTVGFWSWLVLLGSNIEAGRIYMTEIQACLHGGIFRTGQCSSRYTLLAPSLSLLITQTPTLGAFLLLLWQQPLTHDATRIHLWLCCMVHCGSPWLECIMKEVAWPGNAAHRGKWRQMWCHKLKLNWLQMECGNGSLSSLHLILAGKQKGKFRGIMTTKTNVGKWPL